MPNNVATELFFVSVEGLFSALLDLIWANEAILDDIILLDLLLGAAAGSVVLLFKILPKIEEAFDDDEDTTGGGGVTVWVVSLGVDCPSFLK